MVYNIAIAFIGSPWPSFSVCCCFVLRTNLDKANQSKRGIEIQWITLHSFASEIF